MKQQFKNIYNEYEGWIIFTTIALLCAWVQSGLAGVMK